MLQNDEPCLLLLERLNEVNNQLTIFLKKYLIDNIDHDCEMMGKEDFGELRNENARRFIQLCVLGIQIVERP